MFELESELTNTAYVTDESYQREVVSTLPLNIAAARLQDDWVSDWMSLPTDAAENSTMWRVQFKRAWSSITVHLHCEYLTQQCTAATVRLHATVVDDCDNWLEIADVMQAGMSYWYRAFTKSLDKFSGDSTEIRVRVCWTQLQLLLREVDYLMSDTAYIQCRWQLRGMNTVRPSADSWQLRSATFGTAAVWRLFVGIGCSDSCRKLTAGVYLQHISEEVKKKKKKLQWNCTLTVLDKHFTHEQSVWASEKGFKKGDMMSKSAYWWIVLNDVQELSTDTLDLQCCICITHAERFFTSTLANMFE